MYENIIIGGGASALMFATFIEDKERTLIIEHNSDLGAKILISGGGRCNFTNKRVSPKDYFGQESFIKGIIERFDNKEVKSFFTSRGLEIDIKGGSQYFCKNSAKELLNILKREIQGVKLALKHRVLEVKKRGNEFIVQTDRGNFISKRVIVASGGLSYPKVGATPIGFDIAKGFNIKLNTPKPALVGLTLQKEQHFFKALSGISTDCEVKVKDRTFRGNILFAHKGVTGPSIMNASLFWDRGEITLNFLPDFDLGRVKGINRAISNALPLPKRFTKAFLDHIKLKDKSCSKLTLKEYERLKILQNYSFAPAGTFGFSRAEVTKGGVSTDEIDGNSLMSRRVKNLFFIGEVLEIAGKIGGFNFQFAFSSGVACADWINKSKV